MAEHGSGNFCQVAARWWPLQARTHETRRPVVELADSRAFRRLSRVSSGMWVPQLARQRVREGGGFAAEQRLQRQRAGR